MVSNVAVATKRTPKTPKKSDGRELVSQNGENAVYKVGDRVLFRVIFNSPGYMKPGDQIPGTVICVFEAVGMKIHRIELDIRYTLDRSPHSKGEKIQVGNIYAREMRFL